MESLFQFFDDVDDWFVATGARLRRSLSRRPPERRQAPRIAEITPEPASQHVVHGNSKNYRGNISSKQL